MYQIDNIKIEKCRLFLLQVKNWIESRYNLKGFKFLIDSFDDCSELQIQFYSKGRENEEILDQIYRYIVKTFYDPQSIDIRYYKNYNRISLIIKCKYTTD